MRRSLTLLICAILVVSLPLPPSVFGVWAQSSSHYDLLIVGPEKYGDLMTQFIGFKASQGIAARYVAMESMARESGDLEMVSSLHDLVADEYERNGITYLLLVGTYDQVPTRYVYCPSDELGLADFNYKPTDWYYGVPDWQNAEIGLLGGNVPSIAVGRLPVCSEEELRQTLGKIMSVEAQPGQGLFLAIGDPMAMLTPVLGVSQVYYPAEANAKEGSIGERLSKDLAYVMSYSHGTASAIWIRTGQGGWEPLMTCADVSRIRASYRIHYLAACFTGAIDLGNESLARSLLISPTGPALVIASTRTEGSANAISSKFWSGLFTTGDVGLSFLTALQSYLSDSSVFSDQEASFRQYNYYLNKVIYGDVSWRIAEPRATVLTEAPSATTPAPPSSSDPEVESLVAAGTQEGANISASVVTAVPLAFVAVVGLVRLSARGHARRNRSEHLAPYCRDDGKRNS